MKQSWKHDKKLKVWANKVKYRDNYCCQIPSCTITEFLHAHHLNPKTSFPEQAYNIDNGITLCMAHHVRLHSECGQNKNTKSKFLIFFLKDF